MLNYIDGNVCLYIYIYIYISAVKVNALALLTLYWAELRLVLF